jgi:hypothetical protein
MEYFQLFARNFYGVDFSVALMYGAFTSVRVSSVC